MQKKNPLAFILGGGTGTRLLPLTKHRAKPAVPFGGSYRVIDFVLSNLYHSEIRKIYVLTQYESRSLHTHLSLGWSHRFGTYNFVPLHAKLSDSAGWYSGTADAVAQNTGIITYEEPSIVNVFGGDHIYLMDISQMNNFHLEKQADLTISAIPIKREVAAGNYGILKVDNKWQLQEFEEKPENPSHMPGDMEYCLASMGNYAFKPDILLEDLIKDALKKTPRLKDGTINREAIKKNPKKFSSHDFGHDIIPNMLEEGKKIFVYNFMENIIPGTTIKERGYWRDIGDLDQFYKANIELREIVPSLNLYNEQWEILTNVRAPQPAKFVIGNVLESIIANGCIISNSSLVERSVLCYNVRVDDSATVRDSVLLGHDYIGKGAIIERAILDRRIEVPDGETIGVDKNKDIARGFTISDEGITVVPKEYKF